jgi:hypothetical protein
MVMLGRRGLPIAELDEIELIPLSRAAPTRCAGRDLIYADTHLRRNLTGL